MADRTQLRAALLEQRSQLDAREVQRSSNAVAQRVLDLPLVTAATRLATYRAVRGELDADAIVQWAWGAGRRVYLPVTVPPRQMTFARWQRGDEFARSRFGIEEPLPAARRVAATRLDVVLVPLVAFDRRGNRIGHGAGYYDATFAFRLRSRRTRPVLVGLAHAFQEVAHIDTHEWDVPLDFVVTEHQVVDCAASEAG